MFIHRFRVSGTLQEYFVTTQLIPSTLTQQFILCDGAVDTHVHTPAHPLPQTHTFLSGGSRIDLRDYILSQNTKWYLAGLDTVSEPITVCKGMFPCSPRDKDSLQCQKMDHCAAENLVYLPNIYRHKHRDKCAHNMSLIYLGFKLLYSFYRVQGDCVCLLSGR